MLLTSDVSILHVSCKETCSSTVYLSSACHAIKQLVQMAPRLRFLLQSEYKFKLLGKGRSDANSIAVQQSFTKVENFHIID